MAPVLDRAKGDRMRDPEPRAAPPAEKAPRIRGKLFRKYVALFLSVVCIALLTSGLSEIWFSYQEHKASLIRIQHEQAEAAAAKIGQFIKEIDSQIGWNDAIAVVGPARSSSGASTGCGCCARCRPSPSSPNSMPPATSSCASRGLPWMWSEARPTSPKNRNSSRSE